MSRSNNSSSKSSSSSSEDDYALLPSDAVSHHYRPSSIREKFSQGDVIGCYLDLSSGVVGYSKNGVYLGEAFELESSARKSAYFPAIVLKQSQVEWEGYACWR